TVAQQRLDRRQRQARPRLAVPRHAENRPGRVRQVGHGGVARHHPEDEQMERAHRPGLAVPPDVPHGPAGRADRLLGHVFGQIAPDTPQNIRDTRHPWPPWNEGADTEDIMAEKGPRRESRNTLREMRLRKTGSLKLMAFVAATLLHKNLVVFVL